MEKTICLSAVYTVRDPGLVSSALHVVHGVLHCRTRPALLKSYNEFSVIRGLPWTPKSKRDLDWWGIRKNTWPLVISGCPFLLLHYSRCCNRTRSLVLCLGVLTLLHGTVLCTVCCVGLVSLTSRPLLALVIACNMRPVNLFQCACKNSFTNESVKT
jgi:hypothetical protein